MNIVITGASSGIGYHTVLLLIRQGHVVVAVSRNIQKLEKLKSESEKIKSKGKLIIVAGDISDEIFADGIVKEINNHFHQLDVLINNAGLLINKPFEELALKDWKEVYATNVFGAVNITRRLLAMMTEGSHVVNISSMGGVQGSQKFAGLSAYSSSKGALAVLTECLAEEYKNKKISFNCLSLGSVDTEMFQRAFQHAVAGIRVSEMAEYVAWFALNGHRFFNGKVIPVAASVP